MVEIQENNKNKNKIHSKQDIYAFTSQLDYNIETASERIELLNSILYTDEGYQAEFFEDLFDQDARIKANALKKEGEVQDKTRRINLFPTTKQPLSHDIYECKQLEYMGTYILTAPDQPRMDRQQEYNFYDKEEFEKLLKKEKGELRRFAKTECARERYNKQAVNKLEYIDEDTKMAFLKRMGENSKCDGRQKMYKRDYKDPELKDYIIPLEKHRQMLIDRIKELENRNAPYKDKKAIRIRITNLSQHQEDYKTSVKKVIEFKNPLPDSTKNDYEQFNIEDSEQILAMLYMGRKHMIDDDLACMTMDFENIIDKILSDKRYPKLTNKEHAVLSYIKNNKNVKLEEIAEFLEEDFGDKCTPRDVNRLHSQLAKKITEAYYKQLKDFLVEFRWNGVKRCVRCNEWKLAEDFGKDSRISDGLKSFCKKCDNLSKKS